MSAKGLIRVGNRPAVGDTSFIFPRLKKVKKINKNFKMNFFRLSIYRYVDFMEFFKWPHHPVDFYIEQILFKND